MSRDKILFFIIFIMILCYACNSQLDNVRPKDQIAEELLTESDIKNLRNGVYSQMENVQFAFAFDLDARAGNFAGGPGFGMSSDPVNMGVTDGDILNMWQTAFTTLSKVNYLLEIIEKSPSNDKYSVIKGEALYLRALLYYQLVIRWGGVPILVKRTNEIVERSSEDKVWEQITNDLLASEKLLPVLADNFYISVQASQALLAKVYLGRKQKENAILYANKVIDYANSTGRLALANTASEFSDMFVAGTKSPEVIFAFANNTVSSPHLYYQHLNDVDGSWSYSPTESNFRNLYSNQEIKGGDKRSKAVFSLDPTRIIKFPNGRSDQQLSASTNPNFAPMIVTRLSELYLIKAEAQGSGVAAVETLKPYFYARYVEPPKADILVKLSNEQFESLLLDENNREFYAESHRWYDIKRSGHLSLLPNLNGRNYLLYYPVPQTEIDLAGYIQNEGY